MLAAKWGGLFDGGQTQMKKVSSVFWHERLKFGDKKMFVTELVIEIFGDRNF